MTQTSPETISTLTEDHKGTRGSDT